MSMLKEAESEINPTKIKHDIKVETSSSEAVDLNDFLEKKNVVGNPIPD